MESICEICSENTIVAFVEPHAGNPVIQFLRSIRKISDKSYNKEQIFFKKKRIFELFNRNGLKVKKIRYQGYFSPPFAQVMLKPQILFMPLCKIALFLDNIIQKYANNPFSWNIIWTAQKKNG